MIVPRKEFTELAQQAGQVPALMNEVFDLRKRLDAASKERERLTNTIILMRQEGHTLAPEHRDRPWPDGRYVMGDVELEALGSQPRYTEVAPKAVDTPEPWEEDFRRDLEMVEGVDGED